MFREYLPVYAGCACPQPARTRNVFKRCTAEHSHSHSPRRFSPFLEEQNRYLGMLFQAKLPIKGGSPRVVFWWRLSNRILLWTRVHSFHAASSHRRRRQPPIIRSEYLGHADLRSIFTSVRRGRWPGLEERSFATMSTLNTGQRRFFPLAHRLQIFMCKVCYLISCNSVGGTQSHH